MVVLDRKIPKVGRAGDTTVAHCGPTLIGEFARTLTMTDLVIGWTENCSIRNNAAKACLTIVSGVVPEA